MEGRKEGRKEWENEGGDSAGGLNEWLQKKKKKMVLESQREGTLKGFFFILLKGNTINVAKIE